jgi:hypothetical protein
VVLSIVLLCADSIGVYLHFAEFGLVAITLAVTTLRGWGLGEVLRNAAFVIIEEKFVGAQVGHIEGTLEGDDYG